MSFLNKNNRYEALQASAGSGKTHALTKRFVELMLDGALPNQILAITFTKKAASEMKSRIVEAFLDLENSKILHDVMNDFGESKEQILNRRDKLKEKFLNQNLKIYTFDAFFSSILRAFALNLGLSSNFSVDDSITSIQNEKFLSEISKNEQTLKNFVRYIFERERSDTQVYDDLDKFWKNNISLKKITDAKIPSSLDFEKERDKFIDYFVSLGLKERGKKALIKSPREFLKITPFERGFDYGDYKKSYSKDETNGIDAMFECVKKALKKYFDDLEAYSKSGLAGFLETYRKAKHDVNKKLDSVSFADISSLAFYILCGEGKIDSDALYFRLDERITHLLIDEFQDTNITQYQILLPLIDEIVSGLGTSLGSFFYVGDIKQSIYRFRGGKKEIFTDLKNRYEQIRYADELKNNYRSLPILVDFVKEKFITKYENKFEAIAVQKSGGFVRVVSAEKDEIIKNIVNQVIWLKAHGEIEENIAILCWQNKEADTIKNALNDAKIDANTQSSVQISNYALVRAILEFIKFCIFDEKIYAENVKTILGFCADKIDINMKQSVPDTLKKICKILKINEADENILYFFEIANGYKNPVELIFADIKTEIFSKNTNGVKIMTVHKSKGLEFPNVIFCDKLGKDRADCSDFLCEFNFNLFNGNNFNECWGVSQKIKCKENIDKNYGKLLEKVQELDSKEIINELYVGMTRAENSLIVIKNKIDNNSNDFSYFDKILDIKDGEIGKFEPAKRKISKQKTYRSKKIILQTVAPQNEKKDDESNTTYANLDKIYFGEAVHYALEMSENFSVNEIDELINLTKNCYGQFLNNQNFADLKNRLKFLFENKQFKEILKDGESLKEQPLKFNGKLKQMDLLVRKDGEFCIVDYKTSREFEEKNINQVNGYKNAMKTLFGEYKISAFIVFLLKDCAQILEV